MLLLSTVVICSMTSYIREAHSLDELPTLSVDDAASDIEKDFIATPPFFAKLNNTPSQCDTAPPTLNPPPLQPVYYTPDLVFNLGTTKIGFYGFIKADYITETRITGNTTDVAPNTVPLDTDLADRHTQTLLDARSSRLGIKVEDTSNDVSMCGGLEFDFYTTSSDNIYGNAVSTNGRLCRLRLAYALGETPSHFRFLVGQYSALPMQDPEIPMPTRVNLIHYPVGAVDSRQPQFRLGYKHPLNDMAHLQYEVNAEAQGYTIAPAYVTPEGGSTTQASEQKWPLFNAKIAYLSQPFNLEVAGSVSRAYAITDVLGNRLDAAVWGIITNASLHWKNLTLWGTLHHWVGLTGLTSGYFNQMAIVNNQLLPAKANGGAIALRWDFIKSKLWTDIMYGTERCNHISNSANFSGTNPKNMNDFRINLIGVLLKRWNIGIEYERNKVETFDENLGTDHIIHIGVWYAFGAS